MNQKASWRVWWRVLRWTTLVLMLAAVAWTLYLVLPPVPRWVLTLPPTEFLPIKNDLLVSAEFDGKDACGPIRLWDLEAGRPIDRFLEDGLQLKHADLTEDSRASFVLAASGKAGSWFIHRLDFQARLASRVEVNLGDVTSTRFSPGCEFLDVQQDLPDGVILHRILEVATGRVVGDVEVSGPPPDFGKQLMPFHRDGEFSRDGCWFVVGSQRDTVEHTHIFNTRTGKAVVLDHALPHALSRDSHILMAECNEDATWLFDLEAMTWRCRLDGMPADHAHLSPDSRLVAFDKYGALLICDMQTGRTLWQLRSESRNHAAFSPDGRWFGISVDPTDGVPAKFSLYDLHAPQLAWSKEFLFDPEFTPNSRLLTGTTSKLDLVEIFDVATGETRHTFPVSQHRVGTGLSTDGRSLLIADMANQDEANWWKDVCDRLLSKLRRAPSASDFMDVRVYDIETGRMLGRVRTALTREYALSNDRGCLLTVRQIDHDDGSGNRVPFSTTVECWDLPPTHAWDWIIGVPFGLGVAVVGIGAGCSWLRRKRSVRNPAADAARLANPGPPPLRLDDRCKTKEQS